MTWNLHGKGSQHVSTLLTGMEVPADILCFQELGDVRGLAEGSSRTVLETIAGKEYQLFIANPKLSHRCSAVGVALDLEFNARQVHVHDFGILVFGQMHGVPWLLCSLHFPHQQRPDALKAWEEGVSDLLQHLTGLRWDHNIVVGHDLNQNLHAEFDEFEGMMHYREMIFQAGLQTSPALGDTWHARGISSAIDFFLHQVRGAELSFHKREDLRIALPSDHDAMVMTFSLRRPGTSKRRVRPPRTLCGKWTVATGALWEELSGTANWDDEVLNRAFRCPGVSHRPKSLRYQDPPHIRELISRRKRAKDPDERTALMQEVHQLRVQAKAEHKEHLLGEAQAGNCRAIAHMRASAAGGQTEGSYIQRAGGLEQATTDLFQFYDKKFERQGPSLEPAHFQQLADRHEATCPAACTKKEIAQCLRKMKHGVSSGLDGTTYEGFAYLLSQDKQDRIPQYFTKLLRRELPLPQSWRRGRIVLLPKVARPQYPKDLRPICLTPVLGRIFSKVLMRRIHTFSPPYSGHQIGCRKGVQLADGVMAAQSSLQLLKQLYGRAFAAKLDIKAAFDSLDIHAVQRWLLSCSPAKECQTLFDLLHGTEVELALGGRVHNVKLGRGLMQGTSYSADVFSRVLDHFLGPLHDLFDEQFPKWVNPQLGLPHFIAYADDVLVFAESPQALQAKLQQLVDLLQTIGLTVNPDKTRIMSSHDEWHPGVWLRGNSRPSVVEPSLLFLGIPLSHSPQPHSVISCLMRRTSSSYYSFKRIMDSGQAPAHVRLKIFDMYITSKWAWAAPLLMPNQAALTKLEAAKTTYLLSLFRVPTDMLLSWIENVMSRRRAVKVLCRLGGVPDWRRIWLRRQWAYLGHLARTTQKQPMARLLRHCSSSRICTGGVRPGWLVDLLIRRVQRVYALWPWAREFPYWEQLAQDRIQWKDHCNRWLAHWLRDPTEESPATLEYLMNRQLLILKTSQGLLDCILRPAKDFTEQQYLGAVHTIKPGKLTGPFVWGTVKRKTGK